MPLQPYLSGVKFRPYETGDELSAAELQLYVANQVVMVFDSSSDRDTALTGQEVEGMICYLEDVKYPEIYDGSQWVRYARAQDISAVDTKSTLAHYYTF